MRDIFDSYEPMPEVSSTTFDAVKICLTTLLTAIHLGLATALLVVVLLAGDHPHTHRETGDLTQRAVQANVAGTTSTGLSAPSIPTVDDGDVMRAHDDYRRRAYRAAMVSTDATAADIGLLLSTTSS
jgi:hypothetical protein